ncbi:GSCOCG00013446001-RA-CDS [Cotesia congregata]|nr:GSCOCG00013446001-RA-CDS [Cotesia congregata]
MGEDIFPNEIWFEIFSRIDIPQLMELRLVCCHFNELIESILNKHPAWKPMTDNKILYECLEHTMQRAYPYVLISHWMDIDDPVIWRGTYLSFMKWQKVLVNEPTIDAIVSTSNFGDVSCVCTFDKYIAIAYENGAIANYTVDDINQPFYLAYHGTGITQIEFWYSNGDVLVVSLGDNNDLKFWDLENKVEIATNGFFANSISSGECRHFCIGDMEGTLTSYERVGNFISPGSTKNLPLRETQQLIAHCYVGKNMKAMAYEESGTVLFVYWADIEGEKLTRFRFIQEKDWCRLPENINASFQRLIMPNITFFFAIGASSIGSTNYYENEWHEYNLAPHFGSNVRSIALHAQILIFGLDDGSIHLLYIRNYADVMDLEAKIQNSRKIEVDTEPIVDLTILEVDKKPCIVAVTEQKVHLVNFF